MNPHLFSVSFFLCYLRVNAELFPGANDSHLRSAEGEWDEKANLEPKYIHVDKN